MTDNLTLWNAVSKTDPKHTKAFTRGGGFKGTATNPTYLIRKATETFGPVGIGWGWTITDESIMTGAPIGNGAHELVHRVRLKVWFKLDGERGEVEHFGQTAFVYKTKNGLFTDEEAPKKSLTDAITKALSCLGFAADIHLGLYDDNKYVNDRRQEEAAAEAVREIGAAEEYVAKGLTIIETLASEKALSTWWKNEAGRRRNLRLDQEQVAELKAALMARREAVAPASEAAPEMEAAA